MPDRRERKKLSGLNQEGGIPGSTKSMQSYFPAYFRWDGGVLWLFPLLSKRDLNRLANSAPQRGIKGNRECYGDGSKTVHSHFWGWVYSCPVWSCPASGPGSSAMCDLRSWPLLCRSAAKPATSESVEYIPTYTCTQHESVEYIPTYTCTQHESVEYIPTYTCTQHESVEYIPTYTCTQHESVEYIPTYTCTQHKICCQWSRVTGQTIWSHTEMFQKIRQDLLTTY